MAGLSLPAPAIATGTTPFPLGIAAGDPEPDGFVIWTRIALDPIAADGLGGMTAPTRVRWEVAEDEAMQRIVRSGTAQATTTQAHTVHVELHGLRPNRDYFYRFHALSGTSMIGRARTAPRRDEDLSRLRFCFASCSHWEEGYFAAYRHMAEEQPDFVIFLGDYIYEYNVEGDRRRHCVRQHPFPEAVDLAGYRNRYALYKSDANLQELHRSAVSLVTWDDHEVENDYAAALSEDPSVPVDRFLQRRAAGYRAFYEHMPLRRSSFPGRREMRIYDRFHFGRLMDVHLLDGRQYRDREACPLPNDQGGHVVDAACTERDDPRRTMLGFAQERWLIDGFHRSRARWNVVAQDLMVASLRQRGTDGVVGHCTDAWDGYPACRTRILNAVRASRLSNPVFVGGDIHSFWTNDLKADFADPRSATIATEFVGGSVSANPPPYDVFAAFLPDNPHIRYFESRQHGYVAVDVDANRMITRYRSVDRMRSDAPVQTLKAFAVESGRTGAVEL